MSVLSFTEMACCFAMTSIIWLVQIVHYPSFCFIEAHKFVAFANFHSARISLIVAPLMMVELATSAAIFFSQREPAAGLSLVSVSLIWLATFCLSVPKHQKLLREGYRLDVIYSLIRTNWVRTILWSARSAGFIYLYFKK